MSNTIIQIPPPIAGRYDEIWANEITRRLNQLVSGKAPFGPVKIGFNNVDYTQFENDGTMVANGAATCWNDIMAPTGLFANTATGLTFATFTGNISAYRFDIGDIFHVSIQLPHNMKTGTTIYPHLHLASNTAIGATNYNVAVRTEWTWANISTAFPASTIINPEPSVSYQNTAAFMHKIYPLTPIAPITGQGGISSYIMYRVERITASTQPLTGNNIFLLGMDIHYEIDTLGSRSEFTK